LGFLLSEAKNDPWGCTSTVANFAMVSN
jgi:hypothetical protein